MWTLFRPCAKKRYRSDSVIYLLEAQYSVSLFLRKSYIRFYFDLCFGRMANKQITLILLICSVGKFRLKLKWAHTGNFDLLFFFFRWLCCILKRAGSHIRQYQCRTPIIQTSAYSPWTESSQFIWFMFSLCTIYFAVVQRI